MPVIVELRLRPNRTGYVPTTVQLHGLACALFEGGHSPDHDGQEKPFSVWPLAPDRHTVWMSRLSSREAAARERPRAMHSCTSAYRARVRSAAGRSA